MSEIGKDNVGGFFYSSTRISIFTPSFSLADTSKVDHQSLLSPVASTATEKKNQLNRHIIPEGQSKSLSDSRKGAVKVITPTSSFRPVL